MQWIKTWALFQVTYGNIVSEMAFPPLKQHAGVERTVKPRLFLLIEIGSVGFTTRAEQREAYARAG